MAERRIERETSPPQTVRAREFVSVNGRLLPAESAQVSVFDSGFMQGVGLFTTMRAYNGCVFRLDRHLARLLDSARKLGWTTQPDADALRENVDQALSSLESGDARVRLTVTTGSLRGGEGPTELTIVANATPGGGYPEDCYRKGVTVLVSRSRQATWDLTAGHKTTSYFPRLAALREAHAKGAFEAIWMTPDNHMAEGSISSVFVVQDGELFTPPLQTPVLPGITRAAVLELAQRLRIPLEETPLRIEDLLTADEAFLTNSMMEMVPVVRVERSAIGDEKPGELTRRLYGAYGDLIEAECGGG